MCSWTVITVCKNLSTPAGIGLLKRVVIRLSVSNFGKYEFVQSKLPHDIVRVAYSLEYGVDEMEMHKDAITPGQKVILVDDLIATGGTAEGAVKLLTQMGADIVAACFVIDLPDLGGRKKLEELGVTVRTLVAFEGD